MATSSLAIPLRRRIKRACDQCRRRKTKCDGERGCKGCLEIGLHCSYGNPIRQAHGPKYVVHLEKKLRDLKKQVRRILASSISNDEDGLPGLDTEMSSSNSFVPTLNQGDSATSVASFDRRSIEAIGLSPSDKPTEDVVETINYAREDETSNGNDAVSVYRGNSTGVEIVRNLRLLCNSFLGFKVDQDNSAMKMANALDSSFPVHHLSLDSMANVCFPSEAQVYRWIDIAFSDAFTLWPFIDRQLFNFHVQRLLEQKNFGHEIGDGENLGLIHAVIALRQRYDPDLFDVGVDSFKSAEVRGIKHFGVARDLVGLTECGRSVTAVQTVLCMCLYLKSVSAQRMVHTYVSMAGCAAHQLGLHVAASARHLPEKERVIRQRVYITLRIFDAFVTSSLGLPRNLRAMAPAGDTTNAPSIDCHEELLAADANIELLDILGTAVEKSYLTDTIARNHASTAVQHKQLREADRELERWGQKYPVFAQITDDSLATCTKSQLLLRYSKCFVLLILYGPFMHYVAKPWEVRSPNAYARGSKCVEAAIQAVRTAEALDIRNMFHEAYALTVDVLAMAAVTLLVVELGAPDDGTADTVGRTSRNAKSLLEGLAQQNRTAARCLESLTPLYQNVAQTASATTVTTANAPVEQSMQDFTLFPKDNSENPIFNFQLDPFYPNIFVADPPDDSLQTFDYPTLWPDWGCGNYEATSLASSLWGSSR